MSQVLINRVVLVALSSALLAGCQSLSQSQSVRKTPSDSQTDIAAVPAGHLVSANSDSPIHDNQRLSRSVNSSDELRGVSIAGIPVQSVTPSVEVVSKSGVG